jgi:oligoendopeptidase F
MDLSATTVTTLITYAVAKISEPAVKAAYQDLRKALLDLFSKEDKKNVSVPLENIEQGNEAWVHALESTLTKVEGQFTDEIRESAHRLEQSLKSLGVNPEQQINVSSGRDTYVSQQTFGDVKGKKNKITGQDIRPTGKNN